jgi:hypothetical protein
MNHMKECNELACVRAGIGGGFENTTELHVMKFDAAKVPRRCALVWKTMMVGVRFPSRKSRMLQKFLLRHGR